MSVLSRTKAILEEIIGTDYTKPDRPTMSIEQKRVIADEFYYQSQHNPDPLSRALAWRCHQNMEQELTASTTNRKREEEL